MALQSMTRRRFVQGLGAAVCLGSALGRAETSNEDIEERVKAARPLLGGAIPADLPDRLGPAHVAAKYHFTEKPCLLEGAEAILKLGTRVGKFWLGKFHETYPYNSDWSAVAKGARFAEIAKHPYFARVFAMPFTTIALEVQEASGTKLFSSGETFANDEEQMHELTIHLLTAYRDKPCTFILQNWEGDWMVRGAGRDWAREVPPEGRERMAAMAAWWRARQRGVERGRNEARPGARCKVLHAAEVVRVSDSLRNVPNLATHALPEAPVDLVSWSCYEAMGDTARAWRCLDVLERNGRSAAGSPAPVMIGEIGLPETGKTERETVEWWDRAMGLLFARNIRHIFQWALYCNEPLDRKKDDSHPRKADELKGFWWIRPDGSKSWGGQYLSNLLAHAGGKLPNAAR